MTTQADTREAVLIELDGLLETQGRLLFARNDYNEAEATDFGVQLLDFMRRHGVIVRQALSQWSHGEPASLKRDGEQRALTRPEASANTAGENPAGSIFETCPICESEVAAASDHKCRLTPQATALTELRAECERLRGEVEFWTRNSVALRGDLDSAEARADAVERDAARLDYVLAQSVTVETDGDGQFRCVYAWTSPETYGPYAASERAAIDAAIEQDDHP